MGERLLHSFYIVHFTTDMPRTAGGGRLRQGQGSHIVSPIVRLHRNAVFRMPDKRFPVTPLQVSCQLRFPLGSGDRREFFEKPVHFFGSSSTSIRKPNGASSRDFGCTKKTVVPREPGRGASSMILKPLSRM